MRKTLTLGLLALALVFGVVAATATNVNVWTLVWLLVWAGSFAFIEFLAIRNPDSGDTLSEKIRDWIGLGEDDGRTWLENVLFVAFLLFVVWFPIHILTGLV